MQWQDTSSGVALCARLLLMSQHAAGGRVNSLQLALLMHSHMPAHGGYDELLKC